MKINKIFEMDIHDGMKEEIQSLLSECFQPDYPTSRIYYKQLPHARVLALNEEGVLVGHAGLDYRVMNVNDTPVRVLGIIDLCVAPRYRSQGIGSRILLEVESFCQNRKVDFLLLFADQKGLYERNGFSSAHNKCRWLKINDQNQTTIGIGYEYIEELMIKEVGEREWPNGDLDFLGYLY
ncbi:GNAT family N-acetyltransferase [Rossellomorea aquimaris]|uniref:GNAT family N-acetyltransferase n=1 Tax=Rossellomorea aquimaris TaxID=189382 RepID=UPI0007D090AE|nr:GNAT family N-acetyltransferase [Rossellomorea aquimaris]